MIDNIEYKEELPSEIAVLIGKVLKRTELVTANEDSLMFYTEEGETYKMYHAQNCCEGVYIEDLIGNLKDLLGAPILTAIEKTNIDSATSSTGTWTFYEIATKKGFVQIRWHGVSNGYYSEDIDFIKVDN